MRIRPYEEATDYSFYLKAERGSYSATYPEMEIDDQIEIQLQRSVTEKLNLPESQGYTLLIDEIPSGMILAYTSDFGTGWCAQSTTFLWMRDIVEIDSSKLYFRMSNPRLNHGVFRL